MELASNTLTFLQAISIGAKMEIEKEKKFFQFKESGKSSTFYAFTKTGINAINGKAGTGKSLLLNEIALYLLHTQQIKRVIWIDLDNNYTTLKKRNQSQFIQELDNFLILTDEILIAESKNQLKAICDNLAQLESIHTAEQLESGIDAQLYSELKSKADKLHSLINHCDFLALLEFILLSSDLDLNDTAIIIDSLSDLFDTSKADIIQPIAFNILRPLTNKGGTLFYLNHLTKDNGSGKKNYAGSHKLEGKTDYFTLVTKPIANQNLLNVEPTKDRHGNGLNFAFTFDLSKPIGERLFKCDYLDNVENLTYTQNETLRAIKAQLSNGDKTASELEKVCGRVSDGANKQAFFKISQTPEFKEKIGKKQVGKNVFYSLKTPPAIYEPVDD